MLDVEVDGVDEAVAVGDQVGAVLVEVRVAPHVGIAPPDHDVRDPHDHGPRRFLNLGHTFAHALEAAADFDLPHGEAVALGLLAALRLSGRDTETVERELDPQPVSVDPERAWQALLRDKKRTDEEINLVLLGEDGPYLEARSPDEVRAALYTLIAQ